MGKHNKKSSYVEQEVGTRALGDAQLSSSTNPPAPAPKKKSGKQADKKPNLFVRFFQRIGRAFKEMFAELKKVTWLTRKDTFVKLGTVLVVVLVFVLIIFGFDSLFLLLLKLLVPGMEG